MFFYNVKEIEIVKIFKYLEVIFSSSGSFIQAKRYASERATEAMHGILEKGDQSFSDGAINFSLFLVENIHENENCFLFCSKPMNEIYILTNTCKKQLS